MCVLTFSICRKKISNLYVNQLLLGVVFSIGAVVAMYQPFLQVDGYRGDARYIYITLVSALGGAFAAVITAAITIAVRIYIGGTGVELGVTFVVICSLASMAWAFSTRNHQIRSNFTWLYLSIICCMPLAVSYGVIFSGHPKETLVRAAFSCACIFVFGGMMEAEIRRAKREADLSLAAGTDFLTQLPNRRSLHDAISGLETYKSGVSLVAIDVDHFKSINDNYGHEIGDETLRIVGDRLKNSLRASDYVARVGGEEFHLIIKAKDHAEAYEIAERIRYEISQPIQINDMSITVTASAGGMFVSSWDASDLAPFARADEALYKAKTKGRNQTVFDWA